MEDLGLDFRRTLLQLGDLQEDYADTYEAMAGDNAKLDWFPLLAPSSCLQRQKTFWVNCCAPGSLESLCCTTVSWRIPMDCKDVGGHCRPHGYHQGAHEGTHRSHRLGACHRSGSWASPYGQKRVKAIQEAQYFQRILETEGAGAHAAPSTRADQELRGGVYQRQNQPAQPLRWEEEAEQQMGETLQYALDPVPDDLPPRS